jgi:hypothetical protein
MMKYIDTKQVVTLVVAFAVIFLLRKYALKDESKVLKVGFDGLGHI